MAYRFRRKYFKKRRSFRRRYSRKFSFRRYIRKRPLIPELKWISKVHNQSFGPLDGSKTVQMLPDGIPSGTGVSNSNGKKVKARYITINMFFRLNEPITSVLSITTIRLILMRPRVDETLFNDHMTATGMYGTVEPAYANVLMDSFINIGNAELSTGTKGYYYMKRTLKWPAVMELAGANGNFSQFTDTLRLRVIHMYNGNGTVNMNGMVRLTFSDA